MESIKEGTDVAKVKLKDMGQEWLSEVFVFERENKERQEIESESRRWKAERETSSEGLRDS